MINFREKGMAMKKMILWVGAAAMLLMACNQEPVFSIVPEIEYIDIQPREVTETVDSIFLTIGFTDGDGDLGDLENTNNQSITVRDLRVLPDGSMLVDSLAISRFRIPDLSSNARNPSIQGRIFITLSPTLVFPRNLDEQRVAYSIIIQDRAGNESNVVTTDEILLKKR
jgi:hypothetical protein